MLPNVAPALLFVTNLCVKDKIGHLLGSNSWFQHCASCQERHQREENAQLTSTELKTEESHFRRRKHLKGNL